ncbi:hypothetical protein [Streptomyces prasinosporus]|uniref:hypothetical protein n=1 Tax=Streptomyces prasinosporus TaxID=68256 RepID=UPI0031E560B8
MHLTRDTKNGQWRIDAVPQGVVMGKSDFQRNYMSVNKYYFASNSEGADAGAPPAAVADPVYVRSHVDPTTQMVRSLLAGPTTWLDPVVRSGFPAGTALRKGAGPADDGRPRQADRAAQRQGRPGPAPNGAREMAAQLLFTLRNLSPGGGGGRSAGRRGAAVLAHPRRAPRPWPPEGALNRPDYLYFVDERAQLVRIARRSPGDDPAEAAPGALGRGRQGAAVGGGRAGTSAPRPGSPSTARRCTSLPLVSGRLARRAGAAQPGGRPRRTG